MKIEAQKLQFVILFSTQLLCPLNGFLRRNAVFEAASMTHVFLRACACVCATKRVISHHDLPRYDFARPLEDRRD
jgi:hypothetical protein